MRKGQWESLNTGASLIFTIGHSTRKIEEFTHLLLMNGIELIADVRTVPRSRFNPQFNRDTLPGSLEEARIAYRHFVDLGGLRHSKLEESPNSGWRTPAFRYYADYMMTEQFEAGLDELIEAAAANRTAIMCAEAVPWRCHRNLISDALVVRGFHVTHIISDTGIHEHTLTPWAHVSGKLITYPPHEEV